MSSIQSQFLTTGPSPQQSALSDSQFSSYVKKQSYSAYESLDAGLTIQTREGDLVTLSSNTYSKLDAFMYSYGQYGFTLLQLYLFDKTGIDSCDFNFCFFIKPGNIPEMGMKDIPIFFHPVKTTDFKRHKR